MECSVCHKEIERGTTCGVRDRKIICNPCDGRPNVPDLMDDEILSCSIPLSEKKSDLGIISDFILQESVTLPVRKIQVQTRSEKNGLQFHETVNAAFLAAEKDETIWKISFQSESGERVRMIRRGNNFFYESLEKEIEKVLK